MRGQGKSRRRQSTAQQRQSVTWYSKGVAWCSKGLTELIDGLVQQGATAARHSSFAQGQCTTQLSSGKAILTRARQWRSNTPLTAAKARQTYSRKEEKMEKKKIASIVDMYDKAGKECQKAMSEFLAGVKFALSQREE